MKYFFDTEFIEDGVTIDLLSIGVVCEDGREFYAQNRDANLDAASDWVRDNVFPGLLDCPDDQLLHKDELRDALFHFVNYTHLTTVGADKPEFWAYYGDYDWVVLCQLFGTMMDLPEGWPMFAMDVKQLAVSLGSPELPPQESAEHNALNDARWTHDAWKFLAVPVLETPPPSELTEERLDTIIASEFHNDDSLGPAFWNTEEIARNGADRLRRELVRLGFVGAPVEPVPTDSEMNLRREILDVLAANHTSAYDLRNDLYAIFQGVEPVPAPRLEWNFYPDNGQYWTTRAPWEIHVARDANTYGDGTKRIAPVKLEGSIYVGCESLDAAKSLAEKLQGVLDERA